MRDAIDRAAKAIILTVGLHEGRPHSEGEMYATLATRGVTFEQFKAAADVACGTGFVCRSGDCIVATDAGREVAREVAAERAARKERHGH